MKKNKMILILLAGLCFFGCKTTGQFTDTASLTILIVDENGCGVRDCAVTLSNFNKTEHGITNQNGMCVFNNVPSGEYRLSGRKNGYSKLESESFMYVSKGDIFCFELYSSNFILNEVEALYDQYDYKTALTLLNEIACDKKSSLYAAVCLYKAYGYFQQKNQKSALNELNKMKKADKAFEEIYETLITKITIPNSENEKGEAL